MHIYINIYIYIYIIYICAVTEFFGALWVANSPLEGDLWALTNRKKWQKMAKMANAMACKRKKVKKK